MCFELIWVSLEPRGLKKCRKCVKKLSSWLNPVGRQAHCVAFGSSYRVTPGQDQESLLQVVMASVMITIAIQKCSSSIDGVGVHIFTKERLVLWLIS